MKKLVLIMFLGISLSLGAQGKYAERKNFNIAVFLIDFQDIPVATRAIWPTQLEWERIMFHDKIQNYFKTISNDAFAITGKVYDYHTSDLMFSNNQSAITSSQTVLSNIDFNAPDFVYEDYDMIVFLQAHDARLGTSVLGNFSFTINGTRYSNKSVLYLYYRNGYFDRISSSFFDSLEERKRYLLPLSGGGVEEDGVWYDLSQTEATFCHELIHSLGVKAHANSRTNRTKFDYEPEMPNNSNNFNKEYGDLYDIMGSHTFSNSLNGGFRNYIGLLPQSDIVTVDDFGTQTVTINPINSNKSNRYLEILLPLAYDGIGIGFKNGGYGIEVRKVDELDAFLAHPEMAQNTEGVFVHKMSGLLSLLLDMSPSENINYSWGSYYDIRDVVLKPGMTYENEEIKLSNVIKNGDGSFTLDVQIKGNKNTTPAPTILSVEKVGQQRNVEITWQNNHLTSGNGANIVVELRNLAHEVYVEHVPFQETTTVTNSATTYTTSFWTGAGDQYEARIYVQEDTNNFRSDYSNVMSTGCNLKIANATVHPISCNGQTDGKIEVSTIKGEAPYQYKLEGGNYQSSNMFENLPKGMHTVWVKDSNGCEQSISKYIPEPKELEITTDMDGTDLTVYANYGTGNYQYQLNNGPWQSSNKFSGVVGDYVVNVKDRNGCGYIQIPNDKKATPAPTAISAKKIEANNRIQVTWQNNHLASGNEANITLELRKLTSGSDFIVASSTIPNTATSYTTDFGTALGDEYEIRLYVQESSTNLRSDYSNLVVTTSCDLEIDQIEVHPISCFGQNDGKIEIVAKGRQASFEYKIDKGIYQSSNVFENLTKGNYTVWVRDDNGCEISMVDINIAEPLELEITTALNGTDLTVNAINGTGDYLYQLNNGPWQSSNEFNGIEGDYTVKVWDINGCEVELQGTFENPGAMLTVHPNPTGSNVQIEGIVLSDLAYVDIFNMSGGSLQSQSVFYTNTLHLANLSSGIYILKFTFKNGTKKELRVIKL